MIERMRGCKKSTTGRHAFSREDNKTYVCIHCDDVRVYNAETGTWK